MKQILATLFLVSTLLVPVSSMSALAPSGWQDIAVRYRKVIFEVSYDTPGGCTAFLIDAIRNYALTAAHCDASKDSKIYVDKSPAKVVSKDTKKDLMVVEAEDLGEDRQAIKLANNWNLSIGEEVASFGFGYALQQPLFRLSHVAALDVEIEGGGSDLVAVDAAYSPGQSGAPLLNHAGDLVGIVQQSNDRMGVGVGADVIKDKMGKFFQKDTR